MRVRAFTHTLSLTTQRATGQHCPLARVGWGGGCGVRSALSHSAAQSQACMQPLIADSHPSRAAHGTARCPLTKVARKVHAVAPVVGAGRRGRRRRGRAARAALRHAARVAAHRHGDGARHRGAGPDEQAPLRHVVGVGGDAGRQRIPVLVASPAALDIASGPREAPMFYVMHLGGATHGQLHVLHTASVSEQQIGIACCAHAFNGRGGWGLPSTPACRRTM